MIASPIYRQKQSAEKMAYPFLKYVSQRSLAVALFIAFAFVASVANKPPSKSVSDSLSSSQWREHEQCLSLNSRQLFDNIVGFIKDAFDDPALVDYAKEQGADIPDTASISHSGESDKQAQRFRE